MRTPARVTAPSRPALVRPLRGTASAPWLRDPCSRYIAEPTSPPARSTHSPSPSREPGARHRQEVQVVGVVLVGAGGEALLEDADGTGMVAVTVEGDAERVEVGRSVVARDGPQLPAATRPSGWRSSRPRSRRPA